VKRQSQVEPMPDWTIRIAEKPDAQAVLGLWRVAESLPSQTDTEEAIGRLLERDSSALLIARANDVVIGSLIVGWDGWRGSFYRLAVHPNWRRRGLATALVKAGEERLQRLGAVRLTAIVASEERTAMDFWEAAGYERQLDVTRFVRMLAD
jgi:ribosomal protein S18 acetylase RimI-like enzyme